MTDFMGFIGIPQAKDFRVVTRAHVIACRNNLKKRALRGRTVCNRLVALSLLFEYLCERNAVTHKAVKDVQRLKADSNVVKTLALSAHQACQLLDTPGSDTAKVKCDQAIVATQLYHALRGEQLCRLTVKDARHERRGVTHSKVTSKGEETRYVPLHPATSSSILNYFDAGGRTDDASGSLPPVENNRTGTLTEAITPDAVYRVMRAHSKARGFEIRAHALRALTTTNARDHEADIANVQESLGHPNIATTMFYDWRKKRPENSLTFKVTY